jgi:hypothetical protein
MNERYGISVKNRSKRKEELYKFKKETIEFGKTQSQGCQDIPM